MLRLELNARAVSHREVMQTALGFNNTTFGGVHCNLLIDTKFWLCVCNTFHKSYALADSFTVYEY